MRVAIAYIILLYEYTLIVGMSEPATETIPEWYTRRISQNLPHYVTFSPLRTLMKCDNNLGVRANCHTFSHFFA